MPRGPFAKKVEQVRKRKGIEGGKRTLMSLKQITPEDLVTRTEAAGILKVDTTQVRRWQLGGQLNSRLYKGVHFFLRSDIERFREERASKREKQKGDDVPPGGVLASQVFEALDAGKSPVAIVRELRVAPDMMEKLLDAWRRLGGGLYLHLDDIARLAAKSPMLRALKVPISVDVLEAALGGDICSRCGKELTLECMHCFPRRAPLPEGAIVLTKEQLAAIGAFSEPLGAAIAKAQGVGDVVKALQHAVDPLNAACQECGAAVVPLCEKHSTPAKKASDP